jgi:hypothetical protein
VRRLPGRPRRRRDRRPGRGRPRFIQLVAAREVVGLAADWVAPVFSRPGIAFVPVSDVEPATTAVAWRPDASNPLVEGFVVALAREIRDAVGLATRLHRHATGRTPDGR